MNLKKIIKLFKEKKTFLISAHVNPDSDALASELVLALYLKSQGKKVYVINEESVVPRLRFIPYSSLVKSVNRFSSLSYDAAIVVDCGDLNRIGTVTRLIRPGLPLINIDHHVTNEKFGTINHVLPRASSTSEILFDLLKSGHFKFTKPVAILLYLGIMTDTGSFHYDSVTSHTHWVVSELLKFKFSVSEYYKKLYESISVEDLMTFTKAVNEFELFFQGQVICVELKKSMLRKFSSEFDVREKIFSYLRAIKDVDVIAILTEYNSHVTRVNFRSQGKINVAKLAYGFSGGGHKRASGCVLELDLKKAKEKVLVQLEKLLKNN